MFYRMNSSKLMNISNSTTPQGERLIDVPLQWNNIDWSRVENNVNRLQTRITNKMLEPYAMKVARTVLRRGRASNRSSLFGDRA